MAPAATITAMGDADVVAVRHAPGGEQETIGFIGRDRERIFAAAHLPAGRPRGVAIVCPALYSEQLTNYRTEVLLARAMASAGVACARFQYRGTGNSDDLHGDGLTFETMVEDASLVAQWLSDLAGEPVSDFIGVRLGALVAGNMAARRRGTGLCLIEPALDGGRWLRELRRAQRAAALRRPSAPGEEARPPDGSGPFDAFGYRIEPSLAESLSGRALSNELGDTTPPLLLVQIAVVTELRRELAEWGEGRRLLGSPVRTVTIRQSRSWWFVPDAWETEEQRPETAALTGAVVPWLAERQPVL